MTVIATGFIPLTTVHCFDNGYKGNQPLAEKENCAESQVKNSKKAWIGVLATKILLKYC